ncbi:MAG: peptidase M3, partial [Myxococcota bacterium]
MRQDVQEFVNELNHGYEALHTTKEDAFWSSYMGLTSEPDAARKRFQAAEIALQRWLRDESRLAQVRTTLEAVESGELSAGEDDLTCLRGWLRTLEAHGIP